MNKFNLTMGICAATLLVATAVKASNVTGLTTFTSGTPALASEVNGNFTAVKTAVDNNHSRITTLETSPSITGNLTLVPSTGSAGSIMKGATRFLHDFGTLNTFLGENAGNFTTTGEKNTAVGADALRSNTGSSPLGSYNTAVGSEAMRLNTTGSYNAACGRGALEANTSGNYNAATGMWALHNNTTGIENTAAGAGALGANTTANRNSAFGQGALENVTTGGLNAALGYRAGFNLTGSESNNILVDNLGVTGQSDAIRIGDSQTRAFIAGIRGVTTDVADAIPVVIASNGQLGTVSSSRRVKDHIVDMGKASEVLMQLRPVTFHYKSDQNPKGRTLQYGLIAEEVAKVAPTLVARTSNGEIETVYYQNLVPMLLNEYQKQQRVIEAQATELAKQTARVVALEKQALEIAALRQEVARMAALRSDMIAASRR